jgi:hypothetical protein
VTWAKFDDKMATHPKVVALSDGAFRLHASGILYCSMHLTDGRVPRDVVPGLVPKYQAVHLRELVIAGLWTAPVGGRITHYTIHDYLQWNRSRAEAEAKRAARSSAGRKGAQVRWGSGRADV